MFPIGRVLVMLAAAGASAGGVVALQAATPVAAATPAHPVVAHSAVRVMSVGDVTARADAEVRILLAQAGRLGEDISATERRLAGLHAAPGRVIVVRSAAPSLAGGFAALASERAALAEEASALASREEALQQEAETLAREAAALAARSKATPAPAPTTSSYGDGSRDN